MTRNEVNSTVTVGETMRSTNRSRRLVLDPIERASEILFGLIMVLTFTLSIGATEAGRTDMRSVLIGALGCNFAWGIIDAVMYLIGAWGGRGLVVSAVQTIQGVEGAAAAHAIIAEHLPPFVRPALTTTDLERIRRHLKTLPIEDLQPRIGKEDVLGALGVFLLVFLCLFPVVVPFLLFSDPAIAQRISNAVAIALLFLTGFTFGRHLGKPWRVGLVMVAIGVILVAVAIGFGG